MYDLISSANAQDYQYISALQISTLPFSYSTKGFLRLDLNSFQRLQSHSVSSVVKILFTLDAKLYEESASNRL